MIVDPFEDGYTGSVQEVTNLESSDTIRRYTISVDVEDFVEDLDGPFKEDWGEIEELNQVFRFLSRVSGHETVGDEALTELLGVESPEDHHDKSYARAFQSVYQEAGGWGRVLVTDVPDFPVKAKRSDPLRDYIVLEKHGHPMDRQDQRALEDAVDGFIAFGAGRNGVENFGYRWGTNESGDRQMNIEYVPPPEQTLDLNAPIETMRHPRLGQ